jgi:DUF1009 family protein
MIEKFPNKVAIIAGQGHLPRELYDACIKNNIQANVIGLEDQVDIKFFEGIDIDLVPLHSVSQIIKKIKSKNIDKVILGGRVKRCAIPKLIFDIKGAKLFARIIRYGLSDGSLTKVIINFLENEGFTVLSPEMIAHDMLATKGNMTNIPIRQNHMKDMIRGCEMLYEISKLDVGQALIIQNSLILGVEAVEGTDELIKRCGLIKQKFETEPVLVKICKPTQDKRIDMPCIGEVTIKHMNDYGIRGIGLQAGSCLILNKNKTINLANQHGIFIYGLQ